MTAKKEPSFRESVDLMFNRAVALMDLPPGLEEKMRVCNLSKTVSGACSYSTAKGYLILIKERAQIPWLVNYFLLTEGIKAFENNIALFVGESNCFLPHVLDMENILKDWLKLYVGEVEFVSIHICTALSQCCLR